MEKKRYIKPRSVVIGQDDTCPLMAGSDDHMEIMDVIVDPVLTQQDPMHDLGSSHIESTVDYAEEGNIVGPAAKMHDLWEDW